MNQQEVLDKLNKEYPTLIFNDYPVPLAFKGSDKINAIVLGADPTHIVNEKPVNLSIVFRLDLPHSPYWKGIDKNLRIIKGLSTNNIYVQNVCRNYFKVETSKNKEWVTIARKYWIPYLNTKAGQSDHIQPV